MTPRPPRTSRWPEHSVRQIQDGSNGLRLGLVVLLDQLVHFAELALVHAGQGLVVPGSQLAGFVALLFLLDDGVFTLLLELFLKLLGCVFFYSHITFLTCYLVGVGGPVASARRGPSRARRLSAPAVQE